METNQSKHPQQWDLDYILEPFTGLTPEYMEMSKFLEFPFPFCNNHSFTYDCMSEVVMRKGEKYPSTCSLQTFHVSQQGYDTTIQRNNDESQYLLVFLLSYSRVHS